MPRPRPSPLLIALCLAAQLLVATASLWHHHDDDAAPDQCSVCAAVHSSQTGDIPALTAPALPAPIIEFLTIPVDTDRSVITSDSGLARGPPAQLRVPATA